MSELTELVSATHGAASWSGRDRARVLSMLDRLPALATSVRAPVLVAQQQAASDAGAQREFADLRARAIGGTRGQADRQVDTARTLTRLDGVRAAVLERQVLEPHVEVLATVLRGAAPPVAEFLSSPQGQARVVALAHGSDARQFSRDLALLAAAHDPASFEDEREAARRARYLHLTHASDGTFLRGRLDPLAGQALQAALDATGHRPDDERAPEQARADALGALARHALGALARHALGTTGPAPAPRALPDDRPATEDLHLEDGAAVTTPGVVPQVSLLVPAETWFAVRRMAAHSAAARTSRAPDGSTPHGEAGVASPTSTWEPATSEDGAVVSASELAAALCDCAMTRVVMSAQGVPLDVGRTRRMFTPAQRRAVVARDRVCAWNGCGVPPGYCQVHHVTWWHRDGGRSDLRNAVLLCDFHHHEAHRLDLDVTRVTTGVGAVAGGGASGEAGGRAGRARYEFRDRRGRTHNAPARSGPLGLEAPAQGASVGVESVGVESVGVESVGVESVGVEGGGREGEVGWWLKGGDEGLDGVVVREQVGVERSGERGGVTVLVRQEQGQR
ncbi:HNH endonuclease [Cellulomonas gelida]|nr:HNH endonuclease signature motif containing protein [Cellulomonas gelida]